MSDQPETPVIHEAPQAESPEASADVVRKGEYARGGDFHKNLDPNWSYYPIYINKVELIDQLLHQFGADKGKTLDAGCGEGVLVEKYAVQGWDITGLDKNYASQYVQEGSILEMPFPDHSFDTVLCLDVLEHLYYNDQERALRELRRVLKPDGVAIFSCPNLAHFTARLKFLFRGKLLRTASIGHHPGDRPILEYLELMKKHGFKVVERKGIFPTVPPIWRIVMRYPAKSAGLLRFLRKLPFPINWHFQVLLACKGSPGDS